MMPFALGQLLYHTDDVHLVDRMALVWAVPRNLIDRWLTAYMTV